MRLIVFVVLFGLLQACEDNSARFEKNVSSNRVGTSPDYWLELNNMFGEWEKVALISGYADDYDGCNDIKNLLENEFQRRYRCTLAN